MWRYIIAALAVVIANAVLYFWNPHLSSLAKAAVAAADLVGVVLVVKSGAELVKVGAEIKKLQFEARQRESLITTPDPEQTLRIAQGAKSWQRAEQSKRTFFRNLFLPIITGFACAYMSYLVTKFLLPPPVAAVGLNAPEVSNLLSPDSAAKDKIKSRFEYEVKISNNGSRTAVDAAFSLEIPPDISLDRATFGSPNGNVTLMQPTESTLPNKPNVRIVRVRVLRPGETLTVRYKGVSNRYFQTSGLRVDNVEVSPFRF